MTQPSKQNRINSFLILFTAFLLTAELAISAVLKGLTSTVTRSWVDKALHRWTTRLLRTIKLDYQVFNPHHVAPEKHRPTIVVCNHSSNFDIPLSFLAFPHHSMRMLAKKELFHIPFFGRAMKLSEFPIIDRHNRNQAIHHMKTLKTLMESGIVVWIAPEGTRSPDGQLAPFKKGAFITAIETGATIIPLGIIGANHILSAKSLQLNLHQRAEVHVGKPIDASTYTLDEKDKLIEVVRQRILGLMEG